MHRDKCRSVEALLIVTHSANPVIGGLIVLNIFLRNFSVVQTLNTFKEMSRKIFSARPAAQQAFTAILTRIMKTLSRDELYDSGLLDEALVEQFGAHKIFGYNPAMQLGTRVGVIATATNSNTSTPTRIFSNYNGVGPRHKDCRKLTILALASAASHTDHSS